MTAREAVLDVGRMRVSAAGVDEFYWPLARDEMLAFRDGYLMHLCASLRSAPTSDRWRQVITLLLPHLLGEVMSLFRAHAVTRRVRADGRSLVLAGRSALTEAVWSNREIPDGRLADDLRCGFAPPSRWRRVARASRELVSRRLIPWRSLRPSIDGIVTVALGPTIERHAETVDKPVTFVRIEEWFPPLTTRDTGTLDRRLPDVWQGHLSAALDVGFAAANEASADGLQDHIGNWVLKAGLELDRQLTRLETQPHLLPAELWRGTGGNIWGRILSAACRSSGGRVTGHDHALGIALFRTAHDAVVEHIACDRFMMWSDKQVLYGRRNLDARFIVDGAPELEALPSSRAEPLVDFTPRLGTTPRRVLYVGTLYADDRMTFTPLHPAPMMVDWEARLITALRRMGYEVAIKPHPESAFATPAGFTEMGADIIHGPAEDHFADYDILLFSEGLSTPFFNAIRTQHPMVVADVGLHEWQPEALEQLRRRCGFVRGEISAENRIMMDWDRLEDALRVAPSLCDQSFARELTGC
jgi:hypothetical protein